MSLLTAANSGGPLLTPEAVAQLIVEPLARSSLVLNPAVSRTYPLSASSLRIPILTGDVGPAAFVSEGAEISFSDASFAEVNILPGKLAAITALSREAAMDTDPAATMVLGDSVTRSLSHALEAQFIAGASNANGASFGLGSLPTSGAGAVSTVSLGGAGFTNLDPFIDAAAAVQAVGGDVSAWVMAPATLSSLRKLKTAAGWATPLLGALDESPVADGQPNFTNVTLFGAPVLLSPFGSLGGNVWGLDADRVVVAMRESVDLQVDQSVLFTSDRIVVRATMRVGWAFPYPASLVKITP